MKTFALTAGVFSTIVLGWIAYAIISPASATPVKLEPVVHAPYDPKAIDRNIRFTEARVKKDPTGAIGWAMVAEAYLKRARESDSTEAARSAEAAARKSLALRETGNARARQALVESFLAQHRFPDAVRELESHKYRTRQYADVLIEVGRINEAKDVLRGLKNAGQDPSAIVIQARIADLTGHEVEGEIALRRALKMATENAGSDAPGLAWFHDRLGMHLAKFGKHAEAELEFRAAFALHPRDYKACAGLARLSFQDRRWKDVIEWGTRSNAIAPMADVHADMGDAYAKLGDPVGAKREFESVVALVGRPSGSAGGLHEFDAVATAHGHRLDRQYAMIAADHGIDLEGAYAAAMRDFESRPDIYAYDTLAWLNFRRGRAEEAKIAIVRALETGTNDPQILYHAGMIYAATRENAMAKAYLFRALAADPNFDGVQAERARIALNRS